MRFHRCIGDRQHTASTLEWWVRTSLDYLEESLRTGWGLAPDNKMGRLETPWQCSEEARQTGPSIPWHRDAFLFVRYIPRRSRRTKEAVAGCRNSRIVPAAPDSGFEPGYRSTPGPAGWTTRSYYPRPFGFQTEKDCAGIPAGARAGKGHCWIQCV